MKLFTALLTLVVSISSTGCVKTNQPAPIAKATPIVQVAPTTVISNPQKESEAVLKVCLNKLATIDDFEVVTREAQICADTYHESIQTSPSAVAAKESADPSYGRHQATSEEDLKVMLEGAAICAKDASNTTIRDINQCAFNYAHGD